MCKYHIDSLYTWILPIMKIQVKEIRQEEMSGHLNPPPLSHSLSFPVAFKSHLVIKRSFKVMSTQNKHVVNMGLVFVTIK